MEGVRFDVREAPPAGLSLLGAAALIGSLGIALVAGTLLSIPVFASERYEYAALSYGAAGLGWLWWEVLRPRIAERRVKAFGRTLTEIRSALRRRRSGAHRMRGVWLALNVALGVGLLTVGRFNTESHYVDVVMVAGVIAIANGFRLWSDKSSLLKTMLSWGLIALIWLGALGVWTVIDDAAQDNWAPFAAYIVLLGAALFVTARIAPLSQATMEEMRRRDPRAPILFLRSFTDEAEPILEDQGGLKLETVVSHCVRPYGPFIAIGRPGELRPSGAARKYFTNDAWQAEAIKLMDEAALIVVLPGLTPGLDWEMQRLAEAGRLRKTIFVFPPTQGAARFERLRSLLAQTPEGMRLRHVDLSLVMSLHLARDWRWAVAYSSWTSLATYQAAVDIAVFGVLCADG